MLVLLALSPTLSPLITALPTLKFPIQNLTLHPTTAVEEEEEAAEAVVVVEVVEEAAVVVVAVEVVEVEAVAEVEGIPTHQLLFHPQLFLLP